MRRRRARREPGAPPGRAQDGRARRPRDRSRRAPATSSTCPAPDLGARPQRPAAPARRARRPVGAHRPRRATRRARRAATGAGRRRARRHRRRARRTHWVIAVWPGFVDTAYGVAVDVGSTTVAGHLCDLATGEVARVGRDHEPADPLRRGPDEPRVVRDDARERRGRAHRPRSAPGSATSSAQLVADRRRRARSRASTSCWSATRSCTTSCSASIRRRSAPRRSRSPPTSRSTRGPTTSSSACRTRTCTCCRASPATSAPTPPPRCCRRARTAATTCMLLVDVGTNAEIVLGQPRPAVRGVEPDRPRVRGRAALVRPAGDDRARSNGCASTATRSSRASRSSASTPWSDEPGFAEQAAPRRRSPASAAPGVIEVIAELFLAGVILARRHHRRRRRRPLAARRARRPHVRVRACTTAPTGELRITQNDVRAIQLAKAALQRRASACSWTTPGSSDVRLGPPRRRVRQPHRPAVRARARADPRLRPGDRAQRRQRGRRAARSARCCRRRRGDEIAGVARADRQDRDGHRARASRRTSSRAMGFPRLRPTRAGPRARTPAGAEPTGSRDEPTTSRRPADDERTAERRTGGRADGRPPGSRPTSRRRRSSPAR